MTSLPSCWESWLWMVNCTQLVTVQSALHIRKDYVTVIYSTAQKFGVGRHKSLVLFTPMAERTRLSRGPGLTYLQNLVTINSFKKTYWLQDWLSQLVPFWKQRCVCLCVCDYFSSLAFYSLMFSTIIPTLWICIIFSGWFGGMPGRSSSFGSSVTEKQVTAGMPFETHHLSIILNHLTDP